MSLARLQAEPRRACGPARSSSARRALRRRASDGSPPSARRGRGSLRPPRSSLPLATRSATRRSAGVRPSLRVRPPIAPSSRRARAAQPAAPRSSKPARAASIASRAGRFWRARRRVTPSASSARARLNGSPPTRGALPPARAGDTLLDIAGGAATRPRQRVAWASTQSRPSRRAAASHASSRATASSTSPSSSSASTCSARHQVIPGSIPSAASGASARQLEGCDGRVRGHHSRARPDRELAEGACSRAAWRSESMYSPWASSRARERSPRCAATSADGKRLCGDSASSRTYWALSAARLLGVLGGQTELSGTQLDERQIPESVGRQTLVALAPVPVRASRGAHAHGRSDPTRRECDRARSRRPPPAGRLSRPRQARMPAR